MRAAQPNLLCAQESDAVGRYIYNGDVCARETDRSERDLVYACGASC